MRHPFYISVAVVVLLVTGSSIALATTEIIEPDSSLRRIALARYIDGLG